MHSKQGNISLLKRRIYNTKMCVCGEDNTEADITKNMKWRVNVYSEITVDILSE